MLKTRIAQTFTRRPSPRGRTPEPRQRLGYTIVEVMIVLAVSGAMFVIAASFINGKQESTAFSESSTELMNQMQTIVNDVTNGNYVDQQPSCSASPLPGGAQGTNPNCVFFGKLVHFYRPSAGIAKPEYYQTFLLTAPASSDGSSDLSSTQAAPNIVTSINNPNSLDLVNVKVTTTSGAIVTTTNVGFGLDVSAASGGSYDAGASTVDVLYDAHLTGYGDALPSAVNGPNMVVVKAASICVTDSTRKAKIIIGGTDNNANQLAISIEQQGLGKTCT